MRSGLGTALLLGTPVRHAAVARVRAGGRGRSGGRLAGHGALNTALHWWTDRLALRMDGARPAPDERYPWYHHMARRLADQAGLPMPRLHVSPSPQPNAFATGRSPAHAAICIDEGLLESLDGEERERRLQSFARRHPRIGSGHQRILETVA
jgi:heat shock protein HtpX